MNEDYFSYYDSVPEIYNWMFSNYNRCRLKYYELSRECEYLRYELEGLHGVDYSKRRTAKTQTEVDQAKLDKIETIYQLEKDIKQLETYLNACKSVYENVGNLRIQTAIKKAFIVDEFVDSVKTKGSKF